MMSPRTIATCSLPSRLFQNATMRKSPKRVGTGLRPEHGGSFMSLPGCGVQSIRRPAREAPDWCCRENLRLTPNLIALPLALEVVQILVVARLHAEHDAARLDVGLVELRA